MLTELARANSCGERLIPVLEVAPRTAPCLAEAFPASDADGFHQISLESSPPRPPDFLLPEPFARRFNALY